MAVFSVESGGTPSSEYSPRSFGLRCYFIGCFYLQRSIYRCEACFYRPPLFCSIQKKNQIWAGHRQFCEQFLNPLLLRAFFGIPHNAWYRGAQEGIPVVAIRSLLPFRRMLSWNVFTHIILQNYFQSNFRLDDGDLKTKRIEKDSFPLSSFQRMLKGLQSWINKLEPAAGEDSVWINYEREQSYSSEEIAAKKRFVADFISTTMPKMVWDFGCNTGSFAQLAVEAGAEYVVCMDSDPCTLEICFKRAADRNLPLQVLFIDAANPSSGQGWDEEERSGLKKRAAADAILALAFIHHLALAKNIPLERLVDWLLSLAPIGVIEFVPKSDPMSQKLLLLREDIFDGYNEENFCRLVSSRARIIKKEKISSTGRLLIWFQRN